MKNITSKNRKELKQHLSNTLYKNSFFIMLTSTSSAAFGFIFWMLAARLYPQQDVGLASAVISAMSCVFSVFGLDKFTS